MEDKFIASNSIDKKNEDVVKNLLTENSLEKSKDLVDLFNVNMQKRNAIRILTMNNLLDNITNEIITRLDTEPESFKNEELLKYMQAVENSIDRANKNLNQIEDAPIIQLMQNNQVNINMNSNFNRESRQKITEAVQAIINNIKNTEQNYIEDINEIEE